MKHQDGSAFIIGLMIIIVLVPIGLGVSNNIITGIKTTQQTKGQTKALSIAEAGFEILMYDLMCDITDSHQEDPVHSITISNLKKVGEETWSNYQEHLGAGKGKYKYKVEKYESGPNAGLVKLSVKGKFKEVSKEIIARVYPGGSITDIIDRYKLHLVANEINYPWLERFEDCNGWNLDKLITTRNMVNLFDFDKFKTSAKNSSEQRYFENYAKSYGSNGFGGENIFQEIYSQNGAGAVWKPEKKKDIQTETISWGSWWNRKTANLDDIFGAGHKPLPEPSGNADLPGGLFYLDPDDQGFRFELGGGKLKGPEDDPTVIVVEGDMEFAGMQGNMMQLENIYFVVQGQVKFTNGGKNNFPNLKTKNTFLYSGKDFSWKVVNEETGERELSGDNDDGESGVGAVNDNKAAISGGINNNKWDGPILSSADINVEGKKNNAGKPMYDGQSMKWEALQDGLNDQSETIYPKVISWQEK